MKYFAVLLMVYSGFCYGDGPNNNVVRGSVREAPADSYSLGIDSSIYEDRLYVTPRATYSKDKSDITLSMSNLTVYGASDNYSPYLSYTSLYPVTNEFAILTGGSTGYNFAKNNGLRCYEYLDLRYRPLKNENSHLVMHVGPYYASGPLSELGNQIGYQYGVEARYDKCTVNLDYTSGRSNISGGDVRVSYAITSNYSIVLGASIPAPDSGNLFNGILGFSYKY